METVTLKDLKKTAKRFVKQLKQAGHDAYFVGGCVRDELLGLPVKDYDIATSALPAEIKKIFAREKLLEVGEAFGIIMLVKGGVQFEIATFRGEGEYADGRRPSTVYFTNLQEDAKRRDFTVNALYLDVETEECIDFFGGREDLKRKLIRCVGNPNERFEEDHLRMLRAVRLAVQKGFEIHEDTFAAIKKHSHLVKDIAVERIKTELDKILMSDKPGVGVSMLNETGLLKQILPEVAALGVAKQSSKFGIEGNVLAHTIGALDACCENCEPKLTLRWSLLLHDLGKASAQTTPENAKLGHWQISANLARRIVDRLKFDRKTANDICWLVSMHEIFIGWDGRNDLDKFEAFTNPLFSNELISLHMANRDSASDKEISKQCRDRLISVYTEYWKFVLDDEDRFNQAQKFTLVTGKDLIPHFKGKEVGTILADVRKQYLLGNLHNRKDCLDYVKNKYRPT